MNKRLTDEETNAILDAFDELKEDNRRVTQEQTNDLFRTMMKMNGTVEWDYKGEGRES